MPKGKKTRPAKDAPAPAPVDSVAVLPEPPPISPHSGSKPVGIKVDLIGAPPAHFPDGYRWRWAKVLGATMLEVFGVDGAIIYQAPAANILSVSGPCYTTPLWLSRTYPFSE